MVNYFKNNEKIIAIIGLGYVGLPLAIHFSKKFRVIGYDVDNNKIEHYSRGIDLNNEISKQELENSNVIFTNDSSRLNEANFFIVAVPTPITKDKIPDFKYVQSASETVGAHLSKGSIVVYESTVFPGVTEEICVPILEKFSDLKCGEDFKVGYSPERINPGDKVHTLEKITKLVSGIDEESCEIISSVYNEIIEAGVYKVESIKIAEAAKVIENTQRDVNIAFINELSMIFDKMGINTNKVLAAAKTKWNFLDFKPGLVGGHCISIDPYYFIYKAEELGYHSQLISVCREINDNMAEFIANKTIIKLIENDKKVKNSKVLILGFTFKENSNDIRNTKVEDIILFLENIGIDVDVHDPIANPDEVLKYFGFNLIQDYEKYEYDAIILAVNHEEYVKMDLSKLKLISTKNPILIDVKSSFNEKLAKEKGFDYWSL